MKARRRRAFSCVFPVQGPWDVFPFVLGSPFAMAERSGALANAGDGLPGRWTTPALDAKRNRYEREQENERRNGNCEHGGRGARRCPGRRPHGQPAVPAGRRARAPARPRWRCSSCAKASRAASRCSTSRLSETAERARRASRARTAGTWRASRCARCCPRTDALEPDEQYTMFHPSEVELERDHAAGSWPTSTRSSRRGWCSTRCRSCACWPAARCATGARSWRSSSSSPAGNARCCCSTT